MPPASFFIWMRPLSPSCVYYYLKKNIVCQLDTCMWARRTVLFAMHATTVGVNRLNKTNSPFFRNKRITHQQSCTFNSCTRTYHHICKRLNQKLCKLKVQRIAYLARRKDLYLIPLTRFPFLPLPPSQHLRSTSTGKDETYLSKL